MPRSANPFHPSPFLFTRPFCSVFVLFVPEAFPFLFFIILQFSFITLQPLYDYNGRTVSILAFLKILLKNYLKNKTEIQAETDLLHRKREQRQVRALWFVFGLYKVQNTIFRSRSALIESH